MIENTIYKQESMNKLSVMIFSRNDVEKALDLAQSLYAVADEILLIDSSDPQNDKKLRDALKKQRLSKLRLMHIIALGHPDPLRMYALKKCRYDWVLLIDTDERLTDELRADIKKIISRAKCSAFAVKRNEEVFRGKRNSFYTWQIRLFRKDHVEFRGLSHEQALVRGATDKLDGDYGIDHVVELKNLGIGAEYSKIQKFDRLSYGMYNDMMMEYISKLVMPTSRSAEDTGLGRLTKSLLLAYERLAFRRQGQEISNFDYFMYYFMLHSAVMVKKRDFLGIFRLIPFELSRLKQISGWKEEPDADEIFEISKIINRIGVTKFLELDKEETIKELNRKYKDKRQGMDLLMALIKEKYERQTRKAR